MLRKLGDLKNLRPPDWPQGPEGAEFRRVTDRPGGYLADGTGLGASRCLMDQRIRETPRARL